MDIFVPKFLWISKKLELTFISDKFSNIKSWPRGNVKPGSSGFQPVYHYSARDLPFHLSFSLPLTARHKHCSGEAILGRFGHLIKDFKDWRAALGDYNPEVPDPSSGINFKPFPPWATVQNQSFCPISLPRIDLFDSFGRTPTFRP